MLKQPLYLAIDQGGHGSRAMVFNRQGILQAEGRVAVAAQSPRPGYVEYAAQPLLDATRSAIEQVLRQLGQRAGDVICAGLATQRSNIACWDRQSSEPLAPIISWQDLRNADWMAQFDGKRQWIHQRSGLFANGHYGVSKLLWCQQHLPAVAQAQAEGRLCWGPMASYLVHGLCVERPFLVDPANASRTLLMNIDTLQWDPPLAECFGIGLEALPRLVPSHHHYGTIELAGCAIPLTLVNGDQSAALFAHGQPDADCAYINIGTGAFVQRVCATPLSAAQGLLSSVVWQDQQDKRYVLEGTVNGAASALEWAAAALGLDPARYHQQAPQWLGNDGNDDEPPLFMNAVSGLGSPYWRADLYAHYIGDGAPWQKMVAVYESILFLLYENIQLMDQHLAPAKVIQLSGGVAQLDGLCQRLADLSGLVVRRPQQCEATALGVAFLLSEDTSEWQLNRCDWFHPAPQPELRARYQSWHQHLQDWLEDN